MPSSRCPYGPAHSDDERHDRETLRGRTAEDVDGRLGRPSPERTAYEALLVGTDDVDADCFLQLEDQAGADRLHDGRGAAFLPVDQVVEVAVVLGVDVGDGATPGDVGHPVGHQLASYDQDAGGAGSADELVRREEHRVLVAERVVQVGPVHLDLHIGAGGGEVPERQGSVAVQEGGDAGGVAQDPGDVAGSGEAADLQRAVGVPEELLLQDAEIDVTVTVGRDGDHLRDRLPPGQLVGVVLERSEEDHRALVGRDRVAEVVGVLERRGDPQPQDPDQLGDRTGAARAGEDHARVLVAADGVVDDRPGVLAQAGGLQAGAAGLGVRVGIAGEHLVTDEVLQERQRPPRGGVVGVGHPPGTERPRHHLVVPDHRLPDPAQQRRLGRHVRGWSSGLDAVHGSSIAMRSGGARRIARRDRVLQQVRADLLPCASHSEGPNADLLRRRTAPVEDGQ